MSWTLVHPIDDESPLSGWMIDDIKSKQVEFIILIRAYEETFAQTVHSRTSYRHNEIIFGAKFTSMIKPSDNNSVEVELNKISDYTTEPLSEELI